MKKINFLSTSKNESDLSHLPQLSPRQVRQVATSLQVRQRNIEPLRDSIRSRLETIGQNIKSALKDSPLREPAYPQIFLPNTPGNRFPPFRVQTAAASSPNKEQQSPTPLQKEIHSRKQKMQQLFAKLLVPDKKEEASSAREKRTGASPSNYKPLRLSKERGWGSGERKLLRKSNQDKSSKHEEIEAGKKGEKFTTSSLFSTWNKGHRKYLFVPQGRLASKNLDFSVANVAIKSFSPPLSFRRTKLPAPTKVEPLRMKSTRPGSSSSLRVAVARESSSVASSMSRPRKQYEFYIEPRGQMPKNPDLAQLQRIQGRVSVLSKNASGKRLPDLHQSFMIQTDALTEENLSLDSEVFQHCHLSRAEFQKPPTLDITGPEAEEVVAATSRAPPPTLPPGFQKRKKFRFAKLPQGDLKQKEVATTTDTSSTLMTTHLLKWEEQARGSHYSQRQPRPKASDIGMRKAMAGWARVGRRVGSDARSQLLSQVSSIKRRVLRMPKVEDFAIAFSSLKVPGGREARGKREAKRSPLPFKLTHL